MADCPSIDPLVTPYVDGELDAPARAAIDDHLRACARCHSRVDAERAVRLALAAKRPELQSSSAPHALRARCAMAASGRSGAAPAFAAWRSRAVPLAAAASLVLVVSGAFLYRLTAASPVVMAAELAADHVKCFGLNRVLGTHDDVPTVERTLAARFAWHARLPPAGGAGLELVGARPCLYGEGRVAHIMYRQNGRPVSLFMLPDESRARDLVSVMGHEAAIWSEGGRTFVLLARGEREEVGRMASFVQASLH